MRRVRACYSQSCKKTPSSFNFTDVMLLYTRSPYATIEEKNGAALESVFYTDLTRPLIPNK